MSQTPSLVTLIDGNGKSRKVTLQQELASGGAGAIYSVTGESGTVVKIYHGETLRQGGEEYAEKLACMLQHVPSLPSVGSFVQIAWPFALAMDNSGKFIGFAMPALDCQKTELLESMLQPKQAEKKNLRSDLGARITVSANLAEVVSAIHEQGHQIVDLKPPNLLIYRQELYVTVLDCDGFHINVPGRTLGAPQVTPEYLAPEYHHAKPITKPEQQDRFALAVILFRMLNFGIHPYDCLAKGKSAPTDRAGKVASAMYAYGIRPLSTVSPLPVSAHLFFPEELRRHFDRAFGSLVDRRPSAREWSDILRKYAEKRTHCLKHAAWDIFGLPVSFGTCHRDGVLNRSRISPPVEAFDLERLWRKIESVAPPNEVKEIEQKTCAPSPTPLSDGAARSKKLVYIQKLLVLALVPIACFVTENHLFLFVIIALAAFWYYYPFGRGAIRREKELRALKNKESRERYDALVDDWNKCGSEKLFYDQFNRLKDFKTKYQNLLAQCQEKFDEMLGEIRKKNFAVYMEAALIEHGTIEGIGPGLIEKLALNGICSAADIKRKTLSRVPGFGMVREDRLLAWRDEVKKAFNFDPTSAVTPEIISSIQQPFAKQAKRLENHLHQGLDYLTGCKIEILKYRLTALRPLCEAAKELQQMEVDLALIER